MRRRARGPYAICRTNGPPRARTDREAMGSIPLGGQRRRGPVGPLQPTASWPWPDPPQALRGQSRRHASATPWTPPELEPGPARVLRDTEPARQRPHVDAQRFGEVTTATPAMSHQDSLTAGAPPDSGGGLQHVFQLPALLVTHGPVHPHGILPCSRAGRIPDSPGQSYPRFV